MRAKFVYKGGSGSGNYGHGGRPGKVGGSAGGAGGSGGGGDAAKSVAQTLAKATGFKVTGGDNSSAGISASQLRKVKDVKAAQSRLVEAVKSQGYTSYRDPQKTEVFYENGGTSWNKGNTVVNIRTVFPDATNKYGFVAANIVNYSTLHTNVHVPID